MKKKEKKDLGEEEVVVVAANGGDRENDHLLYKRLGESGDWRELVAVVLVAVAYAQFCTSVL